MPRKENPGPLSAQQQQDLVSEGIDNFELPKSLVTKIAKSAVPDNTKLQKEAILSLVKGSTVFINYLAATAHDVAQSKQHKSISASDVLKALELIELGDLVDPLSAELQVYRDQIKGGSASTSAARRASTASTGPGAAAGPIVVNGKATASSASTTKNKGKEKERTVPPTSAGIANLSISTHTAMKPTETLPPPFTSAPLIYHGHGLGAHSLAPTTTDSVTAAISSAAGIDDDLMLLDDVPVTNAERRDEDGQDIELVDDVEVEEPEEQEPEEEEEMQDIVEVEAQELQEDSMSVEQRGGRTEFKV